MEKYNEKIKEIWNLTLSQIKESVPEQDYSFWFSRISLGCYEKGLLTLYVPSQFVLDRFKKNFASIISNTVSELFEEDTKVNFIIKKDGRTPNIPLPKRTDDDKISSLNIQKMSRNQTTNLNPNYTFESFIPGDNSSFAYNACMAIAKNPGSIYNPCLIYGGVGLGKTHLLQSIGNYIAESNQKTSVLYVTAENFTNEFIMSVNTKNPQGFKKKYRKVSVLLIDDIHFLQGKEGTQNELFNTFNDLYDSGRQIVFTCDRPIEELKDISERLKSRFSRGLNIDLLPPAYETRIAILNQKCTEKNFSMSEEVIQYIAKNVNTNVRDLEASLTKLIAYSHLLKKDISLDVAKNQLKHIVNSGINQTTGLSVSLIIKIVSAYFNVNPSELKSKNKKKSIVYPRQLAMYLARQLTEFSTNEIGYEFGGKTHSTVMYNVQIIESKLKSSGNNEINATIDKLTREIKNANKKVESSL